MRAFQVHGSKLVVMFTGFVRIWAADHRNLTALLKKFFRNGILGSGFREEAFELFVNAVAQLPNVGRGEFGFDRLGCQ